MIILDAPYVSETMLDWCAESQHPVLDNAFIRAVAADRSLNLVRDAEAVERLMAGERTYTNSENALAWIAEHAPDAPANHAAQLFKDKAGTRQALAKLDPQVYFRVCDADELGQLDFGELPTPFVLKPSVGFCSMGVYVISSRQDWDAALADIAENAQVWQQRYPESVVGVGSFVLESYIEGQEYALDCYYDEKGEPHLLNVLRHDFANAEDTSDRAYVTSVDIINQMSPIFMEWLRRVNDVLGVRSFPIHIEVRVKDGHVSPIEFNPLRFAGLSGTDLAWHAYGYRTYEAYLDGWDPDWRRVKESCEGKEYCMGLLGVPEGCAGGEVFDLEGFLRNFEKPLQVFEFESAALGAYAFLFLEMEAQKSSGELDFLLNADLREYLS